MGALDSAFQSMFATGEQRSQSAFTSTDILSLFSRGLGKPNGMNAKSALKLSAVYNAVDQISNDLAKIPFGVYRKRDGSRSRLSDHPVDRLLHYGPNMYMTSFIERKMLGISLLLRGNALQKIIWGNDGYPAGLQFIDWDDVIDIKKVDGDLAYIIRGESKPLLSGDVIHFKWFTFNGIVGVSVITYAALNMGIAIDVQEFSATNFGNKGIRQAVIETEKTLGEKSKGEDVGPKQKIAMGIKAALGERSADRVVVLDDGMKYKPIAITPQEAQIIEQSRFSIEDIARWFNIAPHKIKSLQQATNNNIEQQSLDHVSDCIQPLVTNVEQEYTKKLISSSEIKDTYIKGNVKVILRADMKSQAEAYSRGINFGWLTRNEVRALEDLDKIDGLDSPLTPVNTQTYEQIQKNLNSLGNE
jgi:HK97 family phage portal protein